MSKKVRNNCGIYKITNIVNNKCYIGSSNRMKRRFTNHLSLLRNNKHHSIYLQNAFNKYGESNFKFEVLLECPKEYKLKLEQWFLSNLECQYNMTRDARGGGSVQSKKIALYDLEGVYLKSFSSIAEASLELDIDSSSISKCCKTPGKYRKQYTFRYFLNTDNIEKTRSNGPNCREVGLYEGDVLIKTWDSSVRAGLELKICPTGISQVCRGLKVHTKNYKFKYLEDVKKN